MTGALAVKGFNEISYDELMDVNGGAGFYTEAGYSPTKGYYAEVGFETDNGTRICAGVGTNIGGYLTFSTSL